MQAIGIDIGTTSICGVIVDVKNGEILKSKTVNSEAFIETENSWEKIQSVDKIISLATEILDEFITDETIVIGVTGQMHGIVYTDKDGNAVSPLYTWQDLRGNLPYNDSTYAEQLNSHSGYGNVTDFYNRVNGLVPESAIGFCTIHDYFVMKLCQLEKAQIHITDAASFGCFDLETKSFSVDSDIKIVCDYKIAGIYKNIPVSVAIGDNQASVLSTLASEEEILLNVGTGSQVSIISNKIINSENTETRPYFENKYLIVGAALCGGRAFAILKDFYKELISYFAEIDDGKVYQIMDGMLEDMKSSPLLVDTRFSGTRRDQSIKGSISGITTENFRPKYLTQGILEGMISELYEMYKETNTEKNGIVGSGNGIRKNINLIKIAEEKFGSTLKIPAHTEEAAFGAVLFGLISCGHFKNMAEAQKLIRFSR